MNFEILIIFIIGIFLTINPNLLNTFSNNVLGRILFIILIIIATTYRTYLGILLLVLLISLDQIEQVNVEGMENIQDFRTKNCKGNVLYKDSNHPDVSISDVSKMFPNINFTNTPCNPCNPNCEFTISTSREQLSTQESLIPLNSHYFKSGSRNSHYDEEQNVEACSSLNKSSKCNKLATSINK